MSPAALARNLGPVALVVAVWCALWGEVTVANVLGGLVLAVVLRAIGAARPSVASVRLGPLARFLGIVVVDLAASTVSVAREVLTPTDHTAEGIIAVPVPTSARRHLLLMVVAITLTPGTAVVDADPDDGTLYLHLLHIDRRDAVAEHVRRLADLACRALPHPSDPEFVR